MKTRDNQIAASAGTGDSKYKLIWGYFVTVLQGQLVCEIIPDILFGCSQIQVVALAFLPQNFGKVAGTYEWNFLSLWVQIE